VILWLGDEGNAGIASLQRSDHFFGYLNQIMKREHQPSRFWRAPAAKNRPMGT